ncbi:glycosyltransferase family 4 protein [Oceanirhabdus seepicola]|uniref:Undecaprenyl/decaprenyl-phosphate alpha-N-acetylglucosaminyl 1-phosphate transferase n=1 Tax=Oceanirhabdus seepicola TaxID=2828781 RepID=A0A9J6NZV9_9CLOT|nr:MraY family glycosyltransferase [Oceanirhabdus seepicola]MCM1990071.1 undecaprenyl/decaprenyl-phosphate alpha-N-acetylglucosaminyl 1-phosphate transferase [Oceanirhabdus seepicola]
MTDIFMASGVALIISLFLTPIIIKFAYLVGAVDIPKDERRVHKKPIALLGGVSIYIAFLLGMIIKEGVITSGEVGVIIGGTIIIIGGVWDDLKPLRPWGKMFFQLSAALVLIGFNVSINVITNPFSGTIPYLDIGLLGIPFTIIWVVGITNAFNFIDGLDGLSAGVGFISSVTLLIIAIINGRYDAALVTAVLSGSLLGIIPYNFFPASIFIGDAGAQFIGFILAAASIMGAIKSAATFAVAIPILALGLPIYDTLFAIIRRKINGRPVSEADKGHLHHRLLDTGRSQRKVVLLLYLFSCILGGFSILAMNLSNRRAYFLAACIVSLIFVICLKLGVFEKEKEKK